MRKLLRWIDGNLEEAVLAVLLIVLTVTMAIEVIWRYVFSNSLPWPEELCRFCFIFTGIVGVGVCIRHDGMLIVDVVANLFPMRLQIVVRAISEATTLLMFAYFTYHSWFFMLSYKQSGAVSPALEIPLWIVYSSAFLGFADGVIRQLQRIILLVTRRIDYHGNPIKPGTDNAEEGGEKV